MYGLTYLLDNFEDIGYVGDWNGSDFVHIVNRYYGDPHEISKINFLTYYELKTDDFYKIKPEYIQGGA
tara:strand:+ start:23265 stop:23468 length:204 start_codon:yes stop_codon:yes gene_type:complete